VYLQVTVHKADEKILVLSNEHGELRVKIGRFEGEHDALKTQLAAAVEEGRNMDKTFKRDLQTLCNQTFDQDSLKVFTQLYRSRDYPAGYSHGSANGAEENSRIENSKSGNNASGSARDKVTY
jgi:hypothetical protein